MNFRFQKLNSQHLLQIRQQRLQDIDIFGSEISQNIFDQLLDVLQIIPVVSLDIGSTNLTNNQIKQLFDQFTLRDIAPRQLQQLSLSKLDLSGTMKYLSNYLQQYHCVLRELDMHDCHLHNSDIIEMISGLNSHFQAAATLQRVNLRKNQIQTVGAVKLRQFIEKNSIFCDFDMNLNQINDNTLQWFQQKRIQGVRKVDQRLITQQQTSGTQKEEDILTQLNKQYRSEARSSEQAAKFNKTRTLFDEYQRNFNQVAYNGANDAANSIANSTANNAAHITARGTVNDTVHSDTQLQACYDTGESGQGAQQYRNPDNGIAAQYVRQVSQSSRKQDVFLNDFLSSRTQEAKNSDTNEDTNLRQQQQQSRTQGDERGQLMDQVWQRGDSEHENDGTQLRLQRPLQLKLLQPQIQGNQQPYAKQPVALNDYYCVRPSGPRNDPLKGGIGQPQCQDRNSRTQAVKLDDADEPQLINFQQQDIVNNQANYQDMALKTISPEIKLSTAFNQGAARLQKHAGKSAPFLNATTPAFFNDYSQLCDQIDETLQESKQLNLINYRVDVASNISANSAQYTNKPRKNIFKSRAKVSPRESTNLNGESEVVIAQAKFTTQRAKHNEEQQKSPPKAATQSHGFQEGNQKTCRSEQNTLETYEPQREVMEVKQQSPIKIASEPQRDNNVQQSQDGILQQPSYNELLTVFDDVPELYFKLKGNKQVNYLKQRITRLRQDASDLSQAKEGATILLQTFNEIYQKLIDQGLVLGKAQDPDSLTAIQDYVATIGIEMFKLVIKFVSQQQEFDLK